MKNKLDLGTIVTFYSFKGGVGRTMTVANVAFLAAMNGLRVLTMDWDLEAPGLAYYFRGLLDQSSAKTLKEAPGVLDFVWDWSESIKLGNGKDDLDLLKTRFMNGTVFETGVRSLLPEEELPRGGTLDFIGPGMRVLEKPNGITYEDALATFSWANFFEKEAGGFALNCLRDWAKNKYDLILIDSRTGLADVAGICTIQLPDIVALCFILNRQNIDGVAKVAGAIRARRGDEVQLRALPMRVARGDTSEESDAKARAMSELIRVGGFSPDASAEDFRVLSVNSAENVPFYETLAPFYAVDPQLDPLTLNYLRLASQFVSPQLEVPNFDPEMIDLAKRRLAPRNATTEYIKKLQLSEPARASVEILRLLESALDTELDGGGLEDDYLVVLLDVALSVSDSANDYDESISIQTRCIDLLRVLYAGRPEVWSARFISAIEKYLDFFGNFLDFDDWQSLWEELDSMLLQSPGIGNQIKRVNFHREAAHRYLLMNDVESARQTVGEYMTILSQINKERVNVGADQQDQILAAEVDALIVSGDAYERLGEPDRAIRDYDKALRKVTSPRTEASVELARLCQIIHFRISRISTSLGSSMRAAVHAIEAVRWARQPLQLSSQFVALANSIVGIKNDSPLMVLEFCESLLNQEEGRKTQFASHSSRSPKQAFIFLEAVVSLAIAVSEVASAATAGLVTQLLDLAEVAARNLIRRRQIIGSKMMDDLSAPLLSASEIAGKMHVSMERFPSMLEAQGIFRRRKPSIQRNESTKKS